MHAITRAYYFSFYLLYSAAAVTAVTKRVSGMIIDEIILSKS